MSYLIIKTPIVQQRPRLYVEVGTVIPPQVVETNVVVSDIKTLRVEIAAGQDTDVNTLETTPPTLISIWSYEGLPLTPTRFFQNGTWWIKIRAQELSQAVVIYYSINPDSDIKKPITVELMAGEDKDVNTFETTELKQISVWDAEGLPLTPTRYFENGTWWVKIRAQETSQTVTINYTL